jgi:hypothetical protein
MKQALIFSILILVALSFAARSEIPKTLNYQGVLTDEYGAAVADGSYSIVFKIYIVATNGFALWTETNSVEVNKGIFNITLGESIPLALPFDRQYWLAMSVEGEAELSPRVLLASSPYSLNAYCTRGDNIIPASGSVGIGTLAPAETLDVAGGIKIGNSSKTNAGTIRWTGTDFEGYDGSAWVSFTDIGSGTLPGGSSGQTLYNNGSSWVATSNLFHDGTSVGIGTTSPTSTFEVMGGGIRSRRHSTQYMDIRCINHLGTQITGYSPENAKKSVCINAFHDGSGSPSGETFVRFAVGEESAPLYPMIIKESGRIGIGTLTPDRQLELEDTQPYARLTAFASTGPTIEMKCTNTTADFITYGRLQFIDYSNATKGFIRSEYRSYGGASGMYFGAGGQTRMVMTDDGDIGMGTNDPVRTVDVDADEAALRLTSSVMNGSMIEFRNTNTAATSRMWGRIHFLDTNDDIAASIKYVESSVVPSGLVLAAAGQYGVMIAPDGKVGIGTGTPSRQLTVKGNILIESASTGDPVAEFGEGLDYAEGFDVSEAVKVGPGTVLVIDTDNPGKLTVSSREYDSRVAGITAGAKGLGSGVRLGVGQFDCDVALAGRVYCNVETSGGAIEPGDLLTTSSTPGYAMKAVDYTSAQGAILGKAMERLERGTKGQILVLVTLQ